MTLRAKNLVVATLLFASPCLMRAAHADTAQDTGARVAACLTAAAQNAHVARGVMLVLLYVEGGRPGTVSPNTNGTADLGPMQVNTMWINKVAAHWHTTADRAYVALRDNSCANIEAGSWILGQSLAETHGDLWKAVAYYHSHTPKFGEAYLKQFYRIASTMMARAGRDDRS